MVYFLLKNRKEHSAKTSYLAVGVMYAAALVDLLQLIGHWQFVEQLGWWLIALGFVSMLALITVATVVLVRTLHTQRALKTGATLTGPATDSTPADPR